MKIDFSADYFTNDSICGINNYASAKASLPLADKSVGQMVPTDELSYGFSFTPSSLVLGAINSFVLTWRAQSSYPSNAEGKFFHGGFLNPQKNLRCLNHQKQGDCEQYTPQVVRVLPGLFYAGQNNPQYFEVQNLKNPHCDPGYDIELRLIVKDYQGKDIDEVRFKVQKGKLRKDLFKFEDLETSSDSSQFNRGAGNRNTLRIAWERVSTIKVGSCLMLKLPKGVAWKNGESTCTVVSGLDGGVCEQAQGERDLTTLKICGLDEQGAGKAVVELANFFNPKAAVAGEAHFEMVLRTEDGCEYGQGNISLELEGGGEGGSGVSNGGSNGGGDGAGEGGSGGSKRGGDKDDPDHPRTNTPRGPRGSSPILAAISGLGVSLVSLALIQ